MVDKTERDKVVAPHPQDERVGKLPDPVAMREAWLQIVQPVERAGRLDHIKAQKATTPKMVDTAIKQNYWLTRKTYGMPQGYERIKWHSKEEEEKSA